jgi:DNA mismatch repair protein MutL
MAIRVLSPVVAAQIAAGEVVERPASVVKELVENSIDAGARQVQIEVEQGGRRLIRVSDDGCGIPAAEVEIAFQRHSTSKLVDADDLNRIRTLGFRGEALASIASVSRVTLTTRAATEETGVLLRLEGGQVVTRRAVGRPPGTTVSVEDLFYNVPARRKFLRAEATERRHIDAWVTRYALAYPALRLVLTHDGREVLHAPGDGDVRQALLAVFGLEVGAALLEILPEAGSASPIRVSGFVGPASLHRADRGSITLFVNGRWVQDTRLTYAVIQAYHTFLPTGRYPLAVVMVDLPPEEVDVNVHPAKAEVRFRDADAVFRAVLRTVRQTVQGGGPLPQAMAGRTAWAAPGHPGGWGAPPAQAPSAFQPALLPQREEAVSALPILRVIGQVSAAYIVAEGPDGLYLVDQHAAHERVLYEQLLAQREEGAPSQRLLEPAMVELSAEAAGLVEAHLESLRRLGFELEPFGGTTFLVRAMPALLARSLPAQVLPEVAEGLEEGRTQMDEEAERAVIRRVCKQAAVKAGQVLTRQEMEELLAALERCVSPRTCPHGRPTMIHLSVEQLARQFGREG